MNNKRGGVGGKILLVLILMLLAACSFASVHRFIKNEVIGAREGLLPYIKEALQQRVLLF